ncbi:hypothetical protein Tco_0384450, partial [Tanacetum coccineum]
MMMRERDMELRPTRVRETTPILRTGRPLERRVEECASREGNLHPLLTAHLGRSENGHPLQSTLTSEYRGNQPSTNLGGNLPPN